MALRAYPTTISRPSTSSHLTIPFAMYGPVFTDSRDQDGDAFDVATLGEGDNHVHVCLGLSCFGKVSCPRKPLSAWTPLLG